MRSDVGLDMSSDRNAVSLKNVEFCWQPGQPVLDIPELTIDHGERLFVRGPSGSGKTTLLGLLGGVLTPTSGQIEVLGQEIGHLEQAQRDQFRAEHIGFIFQMFNLIPYLTVVENVTLPLSFAPKRLQKIQAKGPTAEQEALRLLAHLGLSDPHLLQRKVTGLSIGQQQRVAAARALIGSPELIIADEPTSALDTDTREAFIELLFAECKAVNSTLIFVSHDPHLEHLFDRSFALHIINQASAQYQHSHHDSAKHTTVQENSEEARGCYQLSQPNNCCD